MQDILANLKSLGSKKLIVLGGAFVGLMAAVFIGMNTVLAPTYTPLYSELSPTSASRIVSSLEQAGFKVSLSSDGSVVSIPQEDVPRARMVLADIGLPADGMPGWELFDDKSGMGMNTFLQKVNRLRALEGELARSVQTIEGIEAARVHLVLPEREAFSRIRPDPSASVIIKHRRGGDISRRQGMAIRALVASAVPDLAPQKVTVLSSTGETILAEDETTSGDTGLYSRKSEIEDRMASKIAGILSARVGPGNARVEVNVDLSTVREVTRSERFDPEGQVIRSTETREQSSRDQQAASQEVGVAGNLPSPFGNDGGAGGGTVNETQNINEIVNFEIGSTLTETVSEPGAVQRVSVAALVDGSYVADEEGDVTFVPRSPEELERLAELIRASIGFDAERGDQVSVDSLQFVEIAREVEGPLGASLSSTVTANLPAILRGTFALALVAAVLALGIRPLLRMLLESPPDAAALEGPAETPAIGDPISPTQMLAPADSVGGSQSGVILQPGLAEDAETVRIASVQGGVSRLKIEGVGALVAERPAAAKDAVESWLTSTTTG